MRKLNDLPRRLMASCLDSITCRGTQPGGENNHRLAGITKPYVNCYAFDKLNNLDFRSLRHISRFFPATRARAGR